MKEQNEKGAALLQEKEALLQRYEEYRKEGLRLDMSRGKPSEEQLALSEGLLTVLHCNEQTVCEGVDVRNYGVSAGLPAMRRLFSELLGLPEEALYVGAGSSLQLMFDTFARHMLFGALPGSLPWGKQGEISFLCPCPGYDRHFAISETFGAKLIPIPMTPTGPDMDAVEEAVKDPEVKGIWCVPKYANPTGVTYSAQTVRRFADLSPAAEDFRIFWDNAYAVHDLYEPGDELPDLYAELKRRGKENMAYVFSSFSKITFAGGSVSVLATGKENLEYAESIIGKQIISADKVNQLRHVLYFRDAAGVRAHMKKHAAILRPKFEAVLTIFEEELSPWGIGRWTRPRGGYFISLDLPQGTAKRTWTLAAQAGVKLTNVGATFPYGKDPKDENLRIAPSYPSLPELRTAAKILCLCAKLAYIEKLETGEAT